MTKAFLKILPLLFTLSITKITVYYPESLKPKINPAKRSFGEIKYSLANFGKIDYQKKQVLQVLYQEDNEEGCSPFDPIGAQNLPYALLIKRGTCAFTLKTHHANMVTKKFNKGRSEARHCL